MVRRIAVSVKPIESGVGARIPGSYDRAFVGRGDVTLWVSPEAIAAWEPVGVDTR